MRGIDDKTGRSTTVSLAQLCARGSRCGCRMTFRLAALLLTVGAAALTGCADGAAGRAAGMEAVLDGPPRTISAPGALWRVRREPERQRRALLKLLANTPGRRLVYEQRETRSGYAFRLLSERAAQVLRGNERTYSEPVVANGRWAVPTVERVRRAADARWRERLTVVSGDVLSGRALQRVVVATDESIEGADVAHSDRGDIAVSWYGCRGQSGICSSRVAVMPAGGHAFEPSELLSDDVWIGGFEADYSSTQAFASDGDLLVVQDADEVTVRIRPAGGRLGTAQRLGARSGGQLVAAGSGAGRWVVAWGRRRAGGLTIATAAMDRFGVPRRFATGRRAPTRLEIVAGTTSATVAWSDGKTTWTADHSTAWRMAPPRLLKGGLRALAARGDGRVLLVTDDAGAGILRARVRRAGAAAFGAAEPISGTRDTTDVLAEFAPGSGRAVVSVQRNERVPGQDRWRQAILTATRRAR